MTLQKRQQGVTLIELLVVVTIIILLTAIGLPAFKALSNAFESGDSVEQMINSMLATARATAIQDQRYVGVRFQKAFNLDPLKASQYMILIERDAASTEIQSGFRAVRGLNPVKLPDSVGVMDLTINQYNKGTNEFESLAIDEVAEAKDPNTNTYLDESFELWDVTTFSVIFSPEGHLVVRDIVRTRNRDGFRDRDTQSDINKVSNDDVFNKLSQVQAGVALFCQDDYYQGYHDTSVINGLGPEASRLSLVIYKTEPFSKAYSQGKAWTGYLKPYCQRRYVNRYTGALITSKP